MKENTADKKLMKLERGIWGGKTRGEMAAFDDESMSLRRWIGLYMTEYASGRPGTLNCKLSDLGTFYAWYVAFKGHDRITDWTRFTTNAYIESMKCAVVQEDSARKKKGERRWSSRTINRRVDHLRTFAKWAFARVPLHTDPFEKIKRLNTPPLKVQTINHKDMEALRSAAYNLVGTDMKKGKDRVLRETARPLRDRAIFFVMAGTGMRIHELCSLNLDQFRGRRFTNVRGKGDQEQEVSMTREASDILAEYVETERKKDDAAWGGSPALFLAIPQTQRRQEDVDGRLSVRAARNVFYKITRKAFGEEKAREFHPHRLRHTMGDFMNRKGGVTMVQKQLGHKNIAYSAVYAQYSQEDMENALDGIG